MTHYHFKFFYHFHMGNIHFQMISATEKSNKFQKTRFWKEKSAEDMVTLGPTAEATLISIY